MSWSQALQAYSETQLSRRIDSFGARREEIQALLLSCSSQERVLLQYLYATLPLPDVGDYAPRFFLQVVRQALDARRSFSWCAALPEHRFLKDVLYPRVNTEELADCRGLFRERLESRVRGLSLEAAILEVNRWCAEEATYRSTDERTASPLQVYRCGWGRCGEESTFLVTALRSVGIAARQVYAPWWSHCDDNHAWVEAFDGRKWRYLGACEPEPVLDRGWFTHAAARAVLVHTRAFVQGTKEEAAFLFPQTDPACWAVEEGVAWENLTPRYGAVKPVRVQVLAPDGAPVAGAVVSFSVLNMGAPREVARLRTEEEGTVSLPLGQGTVLVSAWQEGAFSAGGEGILEPHEERLTLRLGEDLSSTGPELTFFPPEDGGVSVPSLTQAQRVWRRETLDRAAALREEKARRRQASQSPAPTGAFGRVWDTLTEKDRAVPVDPALLEDSLEAFSWENQVPEPCFSQGLLSPRVGWEVLTPWRQLLGSCFAPEEASRFREDPAALWDWVKARAPLCLQAYAALWGTPAGMLQVGGATKQGQWLLFCAACRTLGIPALVQDGVPRFWKEGAFHPLWGGEETARLCLRAPAQRGAASGQDYTLSRRDPEGWQVLSGADLGAGQEKKLSLAPGRYRLWTVTRLPNGCQLARREDFSLQAGEERIHSLAFREGTPQEMLERCPLPAFVLEDVQGKTQTGQTLFSRERFTLLLFLEVNREPTEHLLNELREQAGALKQTGCGLAFVVEAWEQREDPTLAQTLKALPGAQVWKATFSEAVPTLARRMFQDPDRLPLALLVNRQGEGLFACCGYNVGTAALVLRLLAAAESL